MNQQAMLKLNQARALFESGRVEEARATLQRAVQQHPGAPELASALSLVLLTCGSVEQAVYFAQRASSARPQEPSFLSNLGNALAVSGKTAEAQGAFARSIALRPSPEAHLGLMNIHRGRREYVEAAAHGRAALTLRPGDPGAAAVYGSVLMEMGRARQAVRVFREALRGAPEDLTLATGLCNAMNYAGDVPPEEVFEAHLQYGAKVRRRYPAPLPPPPVADGPERPLRVGILSGDLRFHAVRFLIANVLALPAEFELVCYYTMRQEDRVSAELKARTAGWRNVASASDAELVSQIRADGIDILLELSGHTAGHRLAALGLRAAPVQIDYVGYPNTTGVQEIDYRIVDSITDPPGEADRLASERLLRLDPCFLCYEPPVAGPEPRAGAAGGGFVFGSFNALMKLDDLSVEMWSALLNEVPGSRLLLKHTGLATEGVRRDVASRFNSCGVESERLSLEGPGEGPAAMMEAYQRVDLALDTFPYHGTTTTCEALYMGVPVVTLQGRSCVSRVGGSLLSAVGLSQLIAATPGEYIRTASALAGDPAALAGLRTGLRQRFLASPICDIRGSAARLGALLRGAWREACTSRAGEQR